MFKINMLLLGIITLVMTLPLASLYLSTILIHRIAFLVLLPSALFSYNTSYVDVLSTGLEILGGLFQTSILLLIYSLILLSVFRYNYNLTSYISKNNNLLPILAYIVAILTIFIIFFTDFLNTFGNFDVLFSVFVPVMIYHNPDRDKSRILSDLKGKTGIYQWTHNESGKIYVGSAVNLSERMSSYFSSAYLERFKSMHICNALRLHGYSAFSLSILLYVDIPTNLSKYGVRKLILEHEQYYLDLIFSLDEPNTYNILQVAGSRLGSKHTEEALAKISLALSGENHPMFGKSHSEETKALMSEVRSGENHPMFGLSHSDITKSRMSAAKGGSTIYVYNKDKSSLVYSFPSARKALPL